MKSYIHTAGVEYSHVSI